MINKYTKSNNNINWNTVDSLLLSLPIKLGKQLVTLILESEKLDSTTFNHLEYLFEDIFKKIQISKKYMDTSKNIITCIWAGINLAKVMKHPNRDNNSFQPSKTQLNNLKYIFGNFWSQLSTEEWFSFVTKKNMFPSTWLKGEVYFSDQMKRANLIVDEIINNPKLEQVVGLDGHGSWQFCFWTCMYKAKELGRLGKNRKIRVVVIDFDRDVDQWHRSFLSKDTLCIFGNLFDLIGTLSNASVLSKSVYYFNFCGLGLSTQSRVHKYIYNNICNVRGALTWMKHIPAKMQINIKRKHNIPSEEEILIAIMKEINFSKDDIRTSLQECVSQASMFPSNNVAEMLCGLFEKIPFEHFSVPLLLLDWLEELKNNNPTSVVYLSYSNSRSFGKHKKILQHWLQEEHCYPLTERKDFLTFKAPNDKTRKVVERKSTKNTKNKKNIIVNMNHTYNTRKRARNVLNAKKQWNIGDNVEVDMNCISVQGYYDCFYPAVIIAIQQREISVSFKGFGIAGEKSYWVDQENIRSLTDKQQLNRPRKLSKGDDVEFHVQVESNKPFVWRKGIVYSGGQEKITVKWTNVLNENHKVGRYLVSDVKKLEQKQNIIQKQKIIQKHKIYTRSKHKIKMNEKEFMKYLYNNKM